MCLQPEPRSLKANQRLHLLSCPGQPCDNTVNNSNVWREGATGAATVGPSKWGQGLFNIWWRRSKIGPQLFVDGLSSSRPLWWQHCGGEEGEREVGREITKPAWAQQAWARPSLLSLGWQEKHWCYFRNHTVRLMWAWRSVSSLLNDKTEALNKASTVLLLHSPRTDNFPLSLWRPPPLSQQPSAICHNHRPNRTKWTSSLHCVYHVSP